MAGRLPRTPRAPSLLRIEQRWLPVLAPDLPLPVPVPVPVSARVGERRRSGDGSRGRLAVLQALGLIYVGQKWEQGLPGGKQTWGPAGWAALERLLALRDPRRHHGDLLPHRPGGLRSPPRCSRLF